ncbi:MAG: hypothetical protein ACXVB0_05535 [Mucilaginibacter sp.]
MSKARLIILFGLIFLSLASMSDIKTNIISEGQQPQISVDNKGVIRVVFGIKDEIFCATSIDHGVTFAKPALVTKVPEMHLGMSRGPQIASSAHFSVITAIDKKGNIHWFRLSHSSDEWKDMGTINDLKGSAPEGLMGLVADKKDNFYAVWLDIRTGRNNQIYFSSLSAKDISWSKNYLAYRSPDGHVCECCKPNIAVQGSTVAVMFRNWLGGSRDLYMMKSSDAGKTFSGAQKLGTDTWKLNGCPMDGGGIVVSYSNLISTVWQRKGAIYYAEPGKPETYIGNGRNCSISVNSSDIMLGLQNNDTVKLINLKSKKSKVVGNGDFLKLATLADNKILCVWEQDNKVKFKRI